MFQFYTSTPLNSTSSKKLRFPVLRSIFIQYSFEHSFQIRSLKLSAIQVLWSIPHFKNLLNEKFFNSLYCLGCNVLW